LRSELHDAIEVMDAYEGFNRTQKILLSKYSYDGLNDTDGAKASLTEFRKVWTAEGRERLLLTLPERWTSGYRELVEAGLAEPGKEPIEWFTNELVERL